MVVNQARDTYELTAAWQELTEKNLARTRAKAILAKAKEKGPAKPLFGGKVPTLEELEDEVWPARRGLHTVPSHVPQPCAHLATAVTVPSSAH